jgi:mannitol-specific phosphotransferase system IIBC component
MVAKGMLLKMQEQQQQLQQQQQEQQQQKQQQQLQQQSAVQDAPAPQAEVVAVPSAADGSSRGSSCSSCDAVLLAVQRLEAKLDALAGKVLWSSEQLLHQQQQIMQRLDALEAAPAPAKV